MAGEHYADVPLFDQTYHRNGCICVPFHNILVAAGPFLPPSFDSIERHLELPPEHEFSHNIRSRYRYLSSARVRGDSMIFRDIYDGDTVIFQQSGFEYVENGKVVVIEKVGDEEGFGAWSLKKLVIEQPRSSTRNEFGEEINGDNPVVVLYSYNPQVRPWQLDPSGRYRIRGVLLRSLRPEDVRLVDFEGFALPPLTKKNDRRRQRAAGTAAPDGPRAISSRNRSPKPSRGERSDGWVQRDGAIYSEPARK